MNQDQRAPSDHGSGTGANANFMQPSAMATSSAFGYRRSRQTDTALTGTRLRMPDTDDTELTQPGTISRSGARSPQLPTASLVNPISYGAPQGRNINDNGTRHEPSNVGGTITTRGSEEATANRHAQEAGERSRRTDSKDAYRLTLAPAMDQPPEDIVGSRATSRVSNRQDGRATVVEGVRSSFPGAYHIPAAHGMPHATAQVSGTQAPTTNREGTNSNEGGLLTAELVDPEAEQVQLHPLVDERIAQQSAAFKKEDARKQAEGQQDAYCVCCTMCGIDFSKRSNQVGGLCVAFLLIAVVVLASVLATTVLGQSQTTVAASSQSRPTFAPAVPPSFHPTQNPSRTSTPTTRTPSPRPTKSPTLNPTKSPTLNPTKDPTVPPTRNPTPRPTPFATRLLTALPTAPPTLTLSPSMPVAPTTSTQPSAYVEEWVQLGGDIHGESSFDEAGISVALSSNGTVLAVGAWLNNGVGLNAGHVRVYILAEGQWIQLGDDIDGVAEEDQFGWSVALSEDGMVLAVGADEHDGVNGANSGQLRVFQWNGTLWQVMGSAIDGEAQNDEFGYAVSLSGNGTVVAVGDRFNDGGGADAGSVRIFGWNGLEWLQRGTDLDGTSPDAWFGYSVALSLDGSIVACGGVWDDATGFRSGQARIFHWNGTTWNQLGTTINGQTDDYFGESIALSGNGTVVAVGAANGNYCEVYRFDGIDWSQVGQTINGVANTRFGQSIAMSQNGGVIIIGAILDDSRGDDAGLALVYRLTSDSVWVQVGNDLNGDAPEDWFGYSVAISADGTQIAVGGPRHDGRANNAGHVRVYQLA